MKKITLAFFIAFASFAVFAQDNTTPAAPINKAVFKWIETSHDFGKIEKGKPVTTSFTFTNTGKVPLILSEVRPGCGCTAADYTKEPVLPGKDGFIKATFNAAGIGTFNKSITVNANVEPSPVILSIKGEVFDPNPAPAPATPTPAK